MTVKARVYFVRHGETQSNRDGIIQGQLDTELNEEGREQAVLVANALGGIPFDYAFTSDLKRALSVSATYVTALVSKHPDCESNHFKATWKGRIVRTTRAQRKGMYYSMDFEYPVDRLPSTWV